MGLAAHSNVFGVANIACKMAIRDRTDCSVPVDTVEHGLLSTLTMIVTVTEQPLSTVRHGTCTCRGGTRCKLWFTPRCHDAW